MFFILSKILHFLISPMTWILIVLFWALITKDEKRRKRLLKGGVLLFLFFSNPFILDEFMRKWEVPALSDSALKENYDVGIVLGGIASYDVQLDRVQINRSADRLMQAVRLFREGKIKMILFTGGSGSILHQDVKEGELVKRLLLQMNVPDSSIIIENNSKNTHENAVESKVILEKNISSGKYLLITSGFHMNRAMGCFKEAGLNVTPFVTDRYSGRRKWEFDHLIIPNVYTLSNWNTLMHEWVGVLSYKMMGYL